MVPFAKPCVVRTSLYRRTSPYTWLKASSLAAPERLAQDTPQISRQCTQGARPRTAPAGSESGLGLAGVLLLSLNPYVSLCSHITPRSESAGCLHLPAPVLCHTLIHPCSLLHHSAWAAGVWRCGSGCRAQQDGRSCRAATNPDCLPLSLCMRTSKRLWRRRSGTACARSSSGRSCRDARLRRS